MVAHVWNFGDTRSGPFEYHWVKEEETVGTGTHAGLESGEHTEFTVSIDWPGDEGNPTVTFAVDVKDDVDELIEDNNAVVDWVKGYTLGFSFTPLAYENLRRPNRLWQPIYSPELWVQRHISRLNELLAEAGLEDRVRAELLLISDDRYIKDSHPLKWHMDGWWPLWDDEPRYDEPSQEHPSIDYGLIHELLHQLGTIDLYQMYGGLDQMLLPDANRPGQPAGCGRDYWDNDWDCFRFPEGIIDIMSAGPDIIGAHTAGGLATNTGHRRGYYGEYLYDTPATTTVRVVDQEGMPLPEVTVRFYQLELQPRGHVVDAIPEFSVVTNDHGLAVLPNRGITGIVTETGHQMRPNPFGVIDVVGTNGLFIMQMEGACTNYEWLTVIELNLAYWDGQTGEAVFTKTLRCPPP